MTLPVPVLAPGDPLGPLEPLAPPGPLEAPGPRAGFSLAFGPPGVGLPVFSPSSGTRSTPPFGGTAVAGAWSPAGPAASAAT
ncbi:hypothetical protein ACFU99_38360 [Streptomyces sp. NPDC057654]|uniref:hypothetical protein n=1 Tax=Streptomyces sp. NPDC057654 TaxID=3346196 RepID=UPI0036B4076B